MIQEIDILEIFLIILQIKVDMMQLKLLLKTFEQKWVILDTNELLI
jgi:hypothetical protein